MTAPGSRAGALALSCRDAIAAYYDDPVNGLVLPERRLVVVGLPAVDCELLAVSLESVVPIAGSAALQQFVSDDQDPARMRAAIIGCWIFRCVPTLDDQGYPPAAADEEAAHLDVIDDEARMWAALLDGLAAGMLPGCGGLAFIGWESVTPEGALAGGCLRIQASME